MAWFYETFLPSIFDRAGTNKSMWITQKQTAVCIRYMERHSVRTDEFFGDRNTHLYYTAKWGERDVQLNYSKLNGCGTITFSYNNAEREEATRAAQEERERIERERIALLKRHPERLAKVIADLKTSLENAIADYDDDLADGLEDRLAFDLERIENCRAELAKYAD